MRVLPSLAAATLLLSTLPVLASAHPRRHSSTHATVRHASVSASHSSHAVSMDAERATAIQQALIQRGYLSGSPSGVWDSQTAAAMQKLQGDNGWQTKITPDSRALIKLGLGGSSNNPETAALATSDGQ